MAISPVGLRGRARGQVRTARTRGAARSPGNAATGRTPRGRAAGRRARRVNMIRTARTCCRGRVRTWAPETMRPPIVCSASRTQPSALMASRIARRPAAVPTWASFATRRTRGGHSARSRARGERTTPWGLTLYRGLAGSSGRGITDTLLPVTLLLATAQSVMRLESPPAVPRMRQMSLPIARRWATTAPRRSAAAMRDCSASRRTCPTLAASQSARLASCPGRAPVRARPRRRARRLGGLQPLPRRGAQRRPGILPPVFPRLRAQRPVQSTNYLLKSLPPTLLQTQGRLMHRIYPPSMPRGQGPMMHRAFCSSHLMHWRKSLKRVPE
mmetsp:Transcript_20391/g.53549  ORF Transcript_20391/g.53549 Transcript_20391/m.53549 type:complete len:328 (+) Transcript_20391:260-1243(+)